MLALDNLVKTMQGNIIMMFKHSSCQVKLNQLLNYDNKFKFSFHIQASRGYSEQIILITLLELSFDSNKCSDKGGVD